MKRKKCAPCGRKNQWQDHYTRRAKKENYPARSVYKLDEIQKKHRIIRKGDRVLDLGCSPGSWLLFAAREAGSGGKVVGVDLKPVKERLPGNAQAMVGDIYELSRDAGETLGSGFEVVLSDMAPQTTGHKFSDAVRSFELCRTALAVADELLVPRGRFVCKIFQGEDFKAFCDDVKTRYDRMQIFKPQSSRKASPEIFVIGLGKK